MNTGLRWMVVAWAVWGLLMAFPAMAKSKQTVVIAGVPDELPDQAACLAGPELREAAQPEGLLLDGSPRPAPSLVREPELAWAPWEPANRV